MVNNNVIGIKGKRNMENRTETVYIKDIQAGMKNLTLTCIVLEVGPPVPLKENREVRTVKVADSSACINLAVWDDTGHYINASDILRLTKAYAALWRNSLTLYTYKSGTIEKISEFCMVFNDQLNMSDITQSPLPLPSVAATNPPNGNPALGGSNIPSNFTNRGNTSAALLINTHVGGPPVHPTGGGSSRYEVNRNASQISRNGQHLVEDTNVTPRNRAERR